MPRLRHLADELLWLYGSSLGAAPQGYCEVESAEPPDFLISHNGGLGSALRVEGARVMQGSESFGEVRGRLTADLAPAFSGQGRVMQVVYTRDPENMANKVRGMIGEAYETAARLRLHLKDLLDEYVKTLGAYTAAESLYVVLWTMPESLSRRARKDAAEERAQRALKNVPGDPPNKSYGGQRWLGALTPLRNAHRAFVETIRAAFEAAGFDVQPLTAHELLHETRSALYPDVTDEGWRPRLPGDRLPFSVPEPPARQPGDLLWPRLADQLCPYGGERLAAELVRIGGRVWCPVVVSLCPSAPLPFQSLVSRIAEVDADGAMPWRASFLVGCDGLGLMSFKTFLASLLWWDPVSADNRNLKETREMLRGLRDRAHETIASLRIVLATWADDEIVARRRQAALARAVQQWGGCDTEQSGDALGALLATAPGFRFTSAAPAAAPPMSELLGLLPLSRPASPWRRASLVLRTPDGKLFPYDVRSSKQSAHVLLGNAPMRMGKSVFSNLRLLGLLLHGKNEELPRIGIIDVGMSSSGFLALLQAALGPGRAHLAAFHRLVMDPARYAVNPFDLPLGCRWPTPAHMSLLQNFVSLLLTPIDAESPPDGMAGMAQVAIEFVYQSCIEKAKAYARGVDPELDRRIAQADLNTDKNTTWWELVDQFYARGMEHEAVLVQRYAVPTLADLAAAATDDRVAKMYQGEVTRGETRAQYFWRSVSEAVRRYPILSRPTVFDIGSARIVSLDLMDVSQPGSAIARRQTAVMYMLARYLVAGDFYVTPEHYEALTREQLPDQYRRKHIEGARRLKEEVKEIVYDEFHRTRGQQACRDQVLLDIREGPKHNVGVALFSQMADDFDEAMRALETTVLNFGAAAAVEIDRVVDQYGLPEAAKAVMRHRMRKPSAAGSHVLARFRTASGDYVHHLMVTAGPRLLWALSSTPADVALRSRLYDALGGEDARTALAARFPGGTAEPEIERRIEQRRATGGTFAEEEGQEVIESLAREIIEAFRLAGSARSVAPLESVSAETDGNRGRETHGAEAAAR